MSTELVKTTTNAIDYTRKDLLETIRKTVAQNATDAEFAMFVEFCKGTGLNPFKKEVWFIKTQGYTNKYGKWVEGKVQMMTGINGFYAIANSHQQYDGMEETQIEKDDKGNILRAIAKVWRKDRRFPSVGVAEWKEYFPGKTDKGNSIWETKPSVMIAKVAESIALRKAFPNELNGLYTAEEMPKEYAAPKVEAVDVTPKTEEERFLYRIPASELSAEQFEYMSSRGERCPNPDYWLMTRKLPARLNPYLAHWSEDAFQAPKALSFDDDTPDWMKDETEPTKRDVFDPDADEIAA